MSSDSTIDRDAIDLLYNEVAIKDVVRQAARAIDRNDHKLLAAAVAPDAKIGDGGFEGTGKQYAAAKAAEIDGKWSAVSHNLTTHIVTIFNARAHSEAYAIIIRRPNGGDGPVEVEGGRFLDILAMTRGSWRIVERSYVFDWQAYCDGPDNPMPAHFNHGRRDPADLSYDLSKLVDPRP